MMDIRNTISIIFNLTLENPDQISKYYTIFKWVYDNHPDQLDRWIESISPNQILCKQWLVGELLKIIDSKKKHWPEPAYTIELIGGWFAWPLLDLLDKKFPIDTIRNVDMDHFCAQVSQKYDEIFQPTFEYKFIHENILNIPEHGETRKTRFVINTSCEHMPPMKEIKESRGYNLDKALFILQSNNKKDEPDHINCVESADELAKQAGLTNIWYKGELDLGNYKRFMVMGK